MELMGGPEPTMSVDVAEGRVDAQRDALAPVVDVLADAVGSVLSAQDADLKRSEQRLRTVGNTAVNQQQRMVEPVLDVMGTAALSAVGGQAEMLPVGMPNPFVPAGPGPGITVVDFGSAVGWVNYTRTVLWASGPNAGYEAQSADVAANPPDMFLLPDEVAWPFGLPSQWVTLRDGRIWYAVNAATESIDVAREPSARDLAFNPGLGDKGVVYTAAGPVSPATGRVSVGTEVGVRLWYAYGPQTQPPPPPPPPPDPVPPPPPPLPPPEPPPPNPCLDECALVDACAGKRIQGAQVMQVAPLDAELGPTANMLSGCAGRLYQRSLQASLPAQAILDAWASGDPERVLFPPVTDEVTPWRLIPSLERG